MSENPQIPNVPTAPGGKCVMHLADGTSYTFHCDTNQPYTSTPATMPTSDTMPPGRPPSAGLPEVSGQLPQTGTSTTEPLLGFAGLLIVVGIPLVAWSSWKQKQARDRATARLRHPIYNPRVEKRDP